MLFCALSDKVMDAPACLGCFVWTFGVEIKNSNILWSPLFEKVGIFKTCCPKAAEGAEDESLLSMKSLFLHPCSYRIVRGGGLGLLTKCSAVVLVAGPARGKRSERRTTPVDQIWACAAPRCSSHSEMSPFPIRMLLLRRYSCEY